MSQIAIEIGSYSIKAVSRDVVNGRVVKHTLSMPSWCAYEKETDKYYIGDNAKMWRYRNIAFPIYFKENPDDYFRNVAKAIIQYVKMWAELHFPNSPVAILHFVIPMYYKANDPLTEDLKLAADEVGIKRVYFKPSHEAICKRQAYVNNGESVLVFDLGYRNLTISLLRRNRQNYELVAQSECREDCAGMKIDSMLINTMTKELPGDLASMILLEEVSRQIKETLSISNTVRCAIPGNNGVLNIDRIGFNDMISPIITGTFSVAKKMIETIEEKPSEIILCGGSCRIPFIKDRFNYILKEIAPDATVKDCSLLEDMDYLACEGCFLTQNDIEIIF